MLNTSFLKTISNLTTKLFLFCLTIIVFFALSLTACNETQPPSDETEDASLNDSHPEIDSFIIANYKQDAKYLYAREISSNMDHPNRNNPIMDTNEINKILAVIQAVYYSGYAVCDSIFNLHNIHARPPYSLNSISLIVYPDTPSIQNLSKGIVPTGDNKIDDILTTYPYEKITTLPDFPSFIPIIFVYFKYEYYIYPILYMFNNISGVNYATPNLPIGGGNNIKLVRNGNASTIEFSIGWGDCQAGCMYHRYWEFEVIDYKAQFIRSYND